MPSTERYTQLSLHDDGDAADDESATTLMSHGDDDDWRKERTITKQRPARTAKLWICATSASGLLNTILLLVVLVLLVDRRQQSQKQDSGQQETTGELTGFAPRFSQQITTFKPDPTFVPENTSEFFTDAVYQRWLSIVPKGLGYLEVKKPERYNNLPTPLTQYPNRTVFTTSMTHQLHCLYAILEAYSVLTSDSSKASSEVWHMGHCFDYLRQSIMCSADVALEGEETTFPDGQTGSDGWDAMHVCRDYSQVLDYLNKNRADDEVWI